MIAARGSRVRSSGIVLPIVLLLSSMLLVTAAAWFEMDLARARAVSNSMDRVVAFHAADSALNRCNSMAIRLAEGVKASPDMLGVEPARWRLKASFEGAAGQAVTPFSSWARAAKPPQCLIEAWASKAGGESGVFLITARGFGQSKASEVWLQQQLIVTESSVSKRWRRVVARPFQGSLP